MTQDSYQPPSYPVIAFITKYGMAVALLIALVILLAGAYAMAITGAWAWLAGAAVAALVLGGVLASYVEVLRILADTLIPR